MAAGAERSRLGGDQRDIRAAERAIDIRFLPVAGGLQDVVADESEGPAQIEARRRDMLDQGRRIGTVRAVAVERGQTSLGGEGDQRIGRCRLDPGEAAAYGPRGDRSFHGVRKGIVAARIDDDEPQLPCRLDRQQNAVKRKCLVVDVGIALEPGVGRDQIIRAVDLDTVTRVIDHGDVGVAGLIGEFPQRAPHIRGLKIES